MNNPVVHKKLFSASKFHLREMNKSDWERVRTIYEEGISTGLATFETRAPGWNDWDTEHMQSCRLVAQYDDDIAGWAALSPVSHRKVYSGLAEVSIYVSSKYRGAGVGLMLLKKLIAVSEENGIWLLQAGIIANNFASISLHEKAGFRLVGYREKLGKLNGCWLDVVVLEKRSQRVGIE